MIYHTGRGGPPDQVLRRGVGRGEKRHRGQPQGQEVLLDHGPGQVRRANRRRPPAGFWRAHGVGAGEEGPGDEEGPAGVLERALVGKLL